MSQLGSFRSGWQNQNLARFILYKFSFLAEPVQVADDIGIDYFCTLFETQKQGNHGFLVPRNSFAIQVKSVGEVSATQRLELTRYLPYLDTLELPYFLGIVDRDQLKLTIYSGEFLTEFFAYKGAAGELEAELCEPLSPDQTDYWLRDIAPNRFLLKFPKVAEVAVNVDDDVLSETVSLMHDLCSTMLWNIAAKLQGLYIYRGRAPDHQLLFAGPTSFRSFQQGVWLHLAQVFFHLNVAFARSQPEGRANSEGIFRLYERFYVDLVSGFGEASLPPILVQTYRDAKNVVEGASPPAGQL